MMRAAVAAELGPQLGQLKLMMVQFIAQQQAARREDAAESDALTVPPKGACKLIGCGLNKVYKLIASGELESFTQGRKRLITTASIRAYIALQMQQPVCRRRQILP